MNLRRMIAEARNRDSVLKGQLKNLGATPWMDHFKFGQRYGGEDETSAIMSYPEGIFEEKKEEKLRIVAVRILKDKTELNYTVYMREK
ncbi:hypothetical protein CEXT_54661 [Caerostris extrusa]|uniref:Uncharacterized protein n=1 Tax=Caerostris extrusa TaxID=172846 RepID=A0AAV4NE01_CAEEX|nr:hypothetical protein CEXT_54661 [Caerostris extrusa]